jgi:hypothetical protein
MARYGIVATLLVASGLATLAAAQPPGASAPPGAAQKARVRSAPVIARVRTREGVLELTRESLAEGGSAARLRGGVALIADVAPAQTSR